MAKGSGTVATSAAEPNEDYDSLGPSGQESWDLIGSLGFRPEKLTSGYSAWEIHGDTKLGPFESLSVLAGEVQRHVKESSEIEMMEDDKGPRLPGVPLVADRQLVEAAGKFKALNTEWSDKGKERTAAQADLMAICHAKPELFKPDPQNSHARICKVPGMTIRVKNLIKEKVEVELDESEDGD